jgi:hypothetical protein
MGCQQSAPLKEETVVIAAPMEVKAATTSVASPVKVEAEAPIETQEKEEEAAPAVAQEVEEVETPAATVAETQTAEPVAVEAAPLSKVVEEKEAPTTRRIRRKKALPTAAKPTASAPVNDENAAVSTYQKTFAPISAIKVASQPQEVAPKRVAFAARTTNSSSDAKAPKVASTKKNAKHKNVQQQKVLEMTMAFQRMLTHADHLDAHLSTRNTYVNQS